LARLQLANQYYVHVRSERGGADNSWGVNMETDKISESYEKDVKHKSKTFFKGCQFKNWQWYCKAL